MSADYHCPLPSADNKYLLLSAEYHLLLLFIDSNSELRDWPQREQTFKVSSPIPALRWNSCDTDPPIAPVSAATKTNSNIKNNQ